MLRRLRPILIQSLRAWIDHRLASKGAALAFYALFSLTPILILMIAVAGYLFGADAAKGRIVAEAQGLIGPEAAQVVQALLATAHQRASGLLASAFATGFLLVGATSAFAELKESLDDIWGVPRSRRAGLKALLRTRLLAIALIMVLAALLVASLLIGAGLAVLERHAGGLGWPIALVFRSLSTPISFAAIACLFAVIYKMLPPVPLSWRDVWIGTLFTALLFSLGRYATGLYLAANGVASGFGAAGSLIALLLWVYYSAQIFYFGAEFTRQYALQSGSLRRSPQPATPGNQCE